VLPRLRHDALICGDHQQDQVNAGNAGQHVLDETLVAGHVNDRCLAPRRQHELGKADVDGDAPGLLFGETVGLDPRKGPNQSGFSVVYVAGGADDQVLQRLLLLGKARHQHGGGPVTYFLPRVWDQS